jgi:two-component system phosphate regulon sensor histidine kinase PhoR
LSKRIFRAISVFMVFILLFFSVLSLIVWSQFGDDKIKDSFKAMRISLISQSGKVLFDNHTAADQLDNHIDRPEVQDALNHGTGESERLSQTLGKVTYYYAIRLNDGNIIRAALTIDSIYAMIYRLIPIMILCLIAAVFISFFAANKLTKRIVAPINSIDPDNPEAGSYDELLPFVRKIEAQKKELTAQLSALENRSDMIKTITENMREGLLLLDENGVILLANRSVSLLLETRHAQGKNIIHACRDRVVLEGVNKALIGEQAETILKKKDRIYSVHSNPAHTGGAVVLFIDVTDSFKAETHRKEFSANVSHELKTPLTTISALSEMIANGTAKQEDTRRFGEKINSQARRLIHLIDDIIQLSRFDEDSAAADTVRFDLREIADSVIINLQENAQMRSISVELEEGDACYVRANMRMIDELLYNLVENAIKYNREGGRVFISIKNEGHLCRMTVRDTGIGIPKEHLGRVFERFYRVDKSRSKKTGDTGLGLSIVKNIVEHHKGKIEIESTENQGTKISCLIPKTPF